MANKNGRARPLRERRLIEKCERYEDELDELKEQLELVLNQERNTKSRLKTQVDEIENAKQLAAIKWQEERVLLHQKVLNLEQALRLQCGVVGLLVQLKPPP